MPTEIMFVAFDHEGALLTKITDKDGKFCTYEYDENNPEKDNQLEKAIEVLKNGM